MTYFSQKSTEMWFWISHSIGIQPIWCKNWSIGETKAYDSKYVPTILVWEKMGWWHDFVFPLIIFGKNKSSQKALVSCLWQKILRFSTIKNYSEEGSLSTGGYGITLSFWRSPVQLWLSAFYEKWLINIFITYCTDTSLNMILWFFEMF